MILNSLSGSTLNDDHQDSLFFLAFAASFTASAQGPSGFVEVPVPTDPPTLDVSRAQEVPPDVFLRQTQQGAIALYHGFSYVNEVEVYVDDDLDTTIGATSGSTVLWSDPPSNLGEYEITVAYVSGADFESRDFSLFVVPAATRAFTSTEQTPDGALTHTLMVWSGHDGGGTLDRPLLVVEGIDAENVDPPAAYYALGISEDAPLFTRGQAEGADIAILDFGDGGRRIQDNAAVTRRVLLDLPSINTHPHDRVDVAGVSMGGVVARYALAKMEDDGESHRTSVFASIDATQQGAIFDVNFQDFIEGLDEAAWPAALARPAGLQLLKDNRFDPKRATKAPTEHGALYAEIAALNDGAGYPGRTLNVGVSFGASSPNPVTTGDWIRVDYVPRTGRDFDLANDQRLAGAGSLLPVDQTDFKGFFNPVPFAFIVYESERYLDPTFIPYDSALDLDGNTSPFDGPLLDAGASPSYHDVIPNAVVDPLLQRLGYELPSLSVVSIDGPSELGGGEEGTFRAITAPANATYDYTWEWKATSLSGGGQQASGGTVTTHYVPYGQWNTAPDTGPVFAHSFPCGARPSSKASPSTRRRARRWRASASACGVRAGAPRRARCSPRTRPAPTAGAASPTTASSTRTTASPYGTSECSTTDTRVTITTSSITRRLA